MRIPEHLVKSVGFVAVDQDPLQFGGTAFVVGVRAGDGRTAYPHLVTAKHVAEAIEPLDLLIGMNAKDGKPRFLKTGGQKWWFHPTEPDSVDIAEFDIGLGDELYIVGLFTRFFGRTHLIPLVRTGNIAMMPKDQLPIKDFGNMEVYLAEGRSIGGLSGSPVFVRSTLKMPVKTAAGQPASISGLGPFHFLGLMHGHWDLPTTFAANELAEAVNMGVSIVVPAKKVLEVLYHPELVEIRRRRHQEELEKR
jgi:hypothetical protein